MWPFDTQAKLLRLLGNLAFYNDKGIDYSRHTPDQVSAERAIGLTKIRELVAAIGFASFPNDFIKAVDSGEVASDFTGKYIDLLKAHFGRRGAL
jgi:hypothetical protein